MSTDRKLKILCLHGYKQNRNLFKMKIGGFIKSLKRFAEFVIIDAPNKILIDENADEIHSTSNLRAWMIQDTDGSFEKQLGYQDSIDLIKEVLESQGEFDGILGFSQGAEFVSIICGLKDLHIIEGNFKFVVLISGYKTKVSGLQYLYRSFCCLPSLHIIGKTDSQITKERSEELVQFYSKSTVIYHEGGHYVPSCTSIRADYKKFFADMHQISNQI